MDDQKAKEISDQLHDIVGRIQKLEARIAVNANTKRGWIAPVCTAVVLVVLFVCMTVSEVFAATPPDQPPAEPTEQCDPWSVEPGQPVPEGC